MRKTFLMLAALAVLTPTLASAYQYKLERCFVKSWSTSGDADAPPQAGYYDLAIDGTWPDSLRGVLSRQSKVLVRDLSLTVANCREGKTRPTGEFRRSAPGTKTTQLRMTGNIVVPGKRGARVCDVVADVPLTAVVPQLPSRPNPGGPGQGGGPAGGAPAPQPGPTKLVQPVDTKPGGPNPGGPGQGNIAAAALPNLQIRTAEALDRGRDAAKLKVRVINTGAGPSAATVLKYMYVKDGQTLATSAPVPPLAAGQMVWVNVGSTKPLAEADKIYLRVDDPNKVSETSEGDNSFIFKG